MSEIVRYFKDSYNELKNFVSSGNSFKAKPGATDALVMALIIAVRMTEYISAFEDDVYNAVNSLSLIHI